MVDFSSYLRFQGCMMAAWRPLYPSRIAIFLAGQGWHYAGAGLVRIGARHFEQWLRESGASNKGKTELERGETHDVRPQLRVQCVFNGYIGPQVFTKTKSTLERPSSVGDEKRQGADVISAEGPLHIQ
ncbi:hypothetical protein CKAH01_06611 [Colletotrichum kahawae]|uniref:Uncharacterized protein n=1 Tax=Colletotrichum kahawae TaxID=34407 RepID=A0AAD9Y947_COLKA|nr:hypothetical protein CKAH01_06611 [Colletotrichum kahawae]